jgi:anhydro-N-acetylmuramic acid kinase
MALRRWLVGLSSASSLNGIDAVLARVDGAGAESRPHLEYHVHWPFPRDLGAMLTRAHTSATLDVRPLGVLHRAVGEASAAAARLLLERAKFPGNQVLALACPGHVYWHEPDGRFASMLTLGLTDVLAERTGITTISDFRGRDVVLGGQGYPLTPIVDHRLFHDPAEHRVLIHLGSTASLVSLPADPGAGLRNIVAFQAAPCTVLLDGLIRLMTGNRESYDPGGKYAVQGRCLDELLQRWLAHPVLKRRPPKCIPGDEFGSDFLQQSLQQARDAEHPLHDVLCTATHFVAQAVVAAIRDFLPTAPTRVILSGGGVRNGFLWRLLEQQLAPVPLESLEAHGVPAEARKPLAHAGLAALTLDGQPGNLPGATGASGPRILGHFTPGNSGNWARCLAWMAAQTAPLRLAAA